METTHTPEPWMHIKGEEMIWSKLEDGCRGIPTCRVRSIMPTDQANATRIVACVNACAGKPNPERWIKEAESMLQKIYDFEHPELKLGQSNLEFILKLAAERDKLKAERQELINLLKQSHDILTKRSIKRSESFEAMTSKFLQALKEQNP